MPDDISMEEILTQAEEAESREWLLTYGDMVTLLLTFFVMLVALSSMDNARFEEVMKSIQFSLGANVAPGGQMGRIDLHDLQRQNLSMPSGRYDEPLLKDIQRIAEKKDLDDVMEVASEGGKVIIRVKGQILFPSGSSSFEPEAGKVLNEIAKIANDHPEYRLDVGGHTDSRPIKTEKFDSNWELSALRATAVLRYLVERGVSSRRLTATGYADTDPLVPNSSAENMAKNRRVEFVLGKR